MYRILNNFFFRTHLNPFDSIFNIVKYEDILHSVSPRIEEAIYLASPILFSEFVKLKGLDEIIKEEHEQVLLSIYRYLSRMSTRCTPFGLFAGCGMGTIGNSTTILLEHEKTRVTRLDNTFLYSLYKNISENPLIKESIKYYPNNSIYKVGNTIRFIETIYTETNRKYQISGAEYFDYIETVLHLCRTGKKIDELALILVNDDISFDDSKDFINELIASQLIIPELDQTVIGDDYLTRIIKLLKSMKLVNTPMLKTLEKINEHLKRLDSGINSVGNYEEVRILVKDMDIPFNEKYLFQVDMINNCTVASINNHVINELKSAVTFLNKITSFVMNENLIKFKEKFHSRYEEQEIPILEALDPEIGLGYFSNEGTISPLIDDLIIPTNNISKDVDDGFDFLIFKKSMKFPDKSCREIIFTDEDVKGLKANWDDLPISMSVMFEILQSDIEDTLIRIISCGGSSAANLVSRFAHIDVNLEKAVRNITQKEQELSSEYILTEIVHSPDARTGNILFRPHIRDYELLFMSSSDLNKDNIIVLSDIMLSVRNDRLILRSKNLNKEIIPRLTSAHNYHNKTLPVYRFLCDLQNQSQRSSLHFTWGSELQNKFSFFPRIKYKNTILALATWIVQVEEIEHMLNIKKESKLLTEAKEWRDKRFIPRYTLMPDSDNELFIDWENVISIRSLFSIIKNRKSIRLTEYLFEPDNAVIRDSNDKPYRNEFIVSLYKEK